MEQSRWQLRQLRYSSAALLSTILLIGIVTTVYIIVQRSVIIVDMTIDNRFTLTPRTQDVIDAAKQSIRPIRITGFYRPDEVIQRSIDDQYWQLYEDASDGFITREYYNPLLEPARATRYEEALSRGIRVFVSFINPDGTIDERTTIPVKNENSQERDMTEALAQLLVAGTYKVYFERGLDTINPIDNTQSGMSILNNLLRANGFITEDISLGALADANSTMPADASVLIIARPRRVLSTAELAVLDDYLQRGGHVFIAADFFPVAENFLAEGSDFNQYLFDRYGLRMYDALVVDPATGGSTQLDITSSVVYAENQLGRNINLDGKPETATLFRLARPIFVSENPPVPNGSVVLSSNISWGERDTDAAVSQGTYRADPSTDIQGPLTLVAFANDPNTNAKLVLVGDGDFLTNGQVQVPQGNTFLFLDSIGWLTGFTDSVEFSPRGFSTTPLIFVSVEQLDFIALLTVVMLPMSMVVLAVFIYFRRYSR